MSSADLIEPGAVPAASGRGVRAAELPAFAVASVLALVAVLHLGLVDAGQWDADEFYHFGLLRILDGTYFWPRLLHWSPRPFSEGLLYAYWLAIRQTGQPLIGPFLAVLWGGVLAVMLAPVFRSERSRMLPRVLLATAVVAGFLLGHKLAEMFYWPMGAVAYLPTLAAASYVALAVLDRRLETGGGRAGIAVALAVGAGSSELGALFAAAFLPLLFLLEWPRRGRGGLGIAWALAPFGLAVVVLALTAFGKGHIAAGLLPTNSPTLHHLWPSIAVALPRAGHEFLTLDPDAGGWRALLSGAAMRVLLFLGFRWCLRRGGFGPVPAAWVLALAAALVLACLGSLVAGYDLLGGACCQRHDTFRQCAYVLVLLALAGLGLHRRIAAGVLDHPAFGPVALLAAALLAFGGRGEELAATYRMYSLADRIRSETWRRGAQAGTEMVFSDTAGPLTRHAAWPSGRFTRDPATPWSIWGIATFFDKQVVRIAPPPPAPER